MFKKLFRKTARDYLLEGTQQSIQGNYLHAIETLSKAIELDSALADAWLHRGIAHLERGQVDLALRDFDESIRLAPEQALGYYNRAQAWLEKGEEERALADLSQALRLSPEDVDSLMCRGIVYFQRKEYDRALADIERAIALGKGEAGYHAKAIVLEEKGNLAGALACWDKVLALNRGKAVALCRRGLLLEKKGERERARADLEKARKKRSELPEKLQLALDEALERLK